VRPRADTGIFPGLYVIPATLTHARFTLDTSCIIAAVGGEQGSNEIEELVELARSGKIGIVITSGFDVDQRRASNERRQANLEWLTRAAILPVPGPFRLGMSQLGGPDVLTDDDIPAVDEAISTIVVGMTPGEAPTKRMQDVHHLTAHHMAKCDAFVTLDDDDMIRKRADLKAKVGIVIVTPSDAVVMARNS
jgi:predicted nucleic acid-binding protein